MPGQRFGAIRLVLTGLLLRAAGGAPMGARYLLVAIGWSAGWGAVLIIDPIIKMVADAGLAECRFARR